MFDHFSEAYVNILKDTYDSPEFTSKPRGLEVKERLCYKFEINNPLNRLPYIKDRNYSISYFVSESLWYLSGMDNTEWISNYSSFWRKISDDGKTANSAYGSRIFKPHNYTTPITTHKSQWDYVLEELCKDGDSRRAVIHIRSPFDSYYAKLDVPCTLTLQFFLRNEKLDLIVSMRSSDAILGIGNDVPAFTLFQELMCLDLSEQLGRKIELGSYRHISNSMHIYERDYDLVKKIISTNNDPKTFQMPPMPSRPPIDDLLKFERIAKKSQDNNEMLSSLNNIKEKMEDYWLDWAKILASHWAGKRGDEALRTELIQSTSFEGYRFFSR